MSDLDQEFAAAVEKVRQAPSDGAFSPSNDYKLRMYALYRQAADGDAHGKRPGMLDPVGRFKFDAWAKLAGMDQAEAKRAYIDEVGRVEGQFG